MSTRMALGFACSLALMLQTSQEYPTKPVRLIEPFGAGGGPDLVSRALVRFHITRLPNGPIETVLGS
jgi:tripartite-type tricarboxylate transporter receptor subunit TctC